MTAFMKAAFVALGLAFAVQAGAAVLGDCKVQPGKPLEILCMVPKEGRGIVVDVHPERPKVKARFETYYTNCGWPRARDIDTTYVFSQQEGPKVWYRYNLGFKPIEGWRNLGADCIQVFITECREVTSAGDGPRVPCTDVLTANGFTIRYDRAEGSGE